MLKGYIYWYITLTLIRIAGMLSLLVDEHRLTFRRGCLVDIVRVLTLSIFWRSADPIDAITWRNPAIEDTVVQSGGMFA